MENPEILTEDQALCLRIKSGDKKAFDAIFIKYYPFLCAYGRRFVCDEEAEEIVQDIMLYLWENRKTLSIEGNLWQYLFKSVKNRSLTLINRDMIKKRVTEALSRQMEQECLEPDFYATKEVAGRIERSIASLPETYRVAFVQHRFRHKTYKEIADEQGVSPKTIAYRIQQALKLLRVELKDLLPRP